ncbi:MAG: LysM peptidoglycan-binding domain-containing protein, partial [Proteobacteria bacterium]|nr:LysM peptidoglycan-binding domain-containing protein [Pseudomonadota bacterium]
MRPRAPVRHEAERNHSGYPYFASGRPSSNRGDWAGSTRLEGGQDPVTVVVRRGDSLWSIARRFSVSTRQIMEWNRLPSAVIHPGDRLEIK